MKRATSRAVFLGLVLAAGCVQTPAPWTPDIGDLSDVPRDGEVLRSDGIGELGIGDKQHGETDARFDIETVDASGETACIPDCEGKQCGGNGCGGTCGSCGDFGGCKQDGTCSCDFEKCAGTCCGDGAVCFDSTCCPPQCDGKECGDDGCGGTCGQCDGLEECGEGGHCDCPFEQCGGACCESSDETCHQGACCLPDCTGKDCGSDGCGGVCADCPEQYACVDEGKTAVCEAMCAEFCAGLECGNAGLKEECECGSCGDGNPCTDDVCTDQQQCNYPANTESCDDGNPCTGQDTCADGLCAGELLPLDQLAELDCLCTEDADCTEIENGTVCDGTLYCHKEPEEAEEGVCAVAPETVLACQDGHQCTEDACDPVDGCVFIPHDEDCDDGNPCTDNMCSLELGCVKIDNELPCDDGDICTDGDTCSGGNCIPGEPVVCADKFDCTEDTCDPDAGCKFIPHNEGCDDLKPCTTDVCSVENGCVWTPDDANVCSDGNVCNGLEVCAGGECVPGQDLDCDDLSLCTLDSCDPTLGCQYENVLCDNNACTTDSCEPAIGCLHEDVVCDDENPCTADSCDVGNGCLNQPFDNDTPCAADPHWVCLDAQCTCVPDCTDIECGDDGCGGSCGECGDETVCIEGQCEWGVLACSGAACPPMDGYEVACNAQAHCEYKNLDDSGWKHWDVWIYVAPGSFEMGSVGEGGGGDEMPVHPVTIDYAYFISKYEIVVSQYEACQAGLCTPADTTKWNGDGWGTNSSANNRADHPQNGLSWQRAKDFCGWVAPGGRLPSEAEWEYAASGPTHLKYPWGDSPDPTCDNDTAVFNEAGGTGGYGCGDGGTWTAGSKSAGASWCGALDMSGNLWEWNEDWYHNSYNEAPSDGSAWADPPNSDRVVRGGSFNYNAVSMRLAERRPIPPGDSYANLGARCLRPVPAKTCGGIDCPAMNGYFVTCNKQQHCEYYNEDTTGHKKLDVWIYVPPGSFQMGCPADPEDPEMCSETGEDPSDELPQHTVDIAYGYFIGKYEIVVEQYEACNMDQPDKCTAALTATWDGNGWGANSSLNNRLDHPQNGLTWQQAKDFCGWVAPGGRLPSEAEWEYAAAGPIHLLYPWGDSPEPTCTNNTAIFNEGGGTEGYGCGEGGTWPVGSKSAGVSSCGALDMSGNVAEWNEDWYHDSYVDAPDDGSPWGEPVGTLRTIRGGAFRHTGAHMMRSSVRSPLTPWHSIADIGARCVRPASPPGGHCGGIECPPLDGYFVTCSKQDHCEYYNENTTGHNKWDVWIYVPPGSFQMGSEGEGGDNDETPVHTVTITKGYFIGKYEIVVEQYEACEADLAEECTSADTMDFPFTQGTNTSGNGRSEHPQNGLTWYQAKDFCGWAAPGGRLPSEAEWEYAATGPTHTKYPWGDIPEPTCSNNTAVFYEAGVVDGFGCGQLGTWKAGSKTTGASWSGALDMSGNLFEWCEDWQHNGYDGAPIDGSAWVDTPDNLTRIIRGGSFDSYAFDLRSARHLSHEPGTSTAVLGARCVRPLEP